MHKYLDTLNHVLTYGDQRQTRNGKTRSCFGSHITCNLKHGFPILTTKEIRIRSIASELAWILSGSQDERYLAKLNGTEKTIWTANAESYQGDFPGDVGKIYGPLLRDFHGVDQLAMIVDKLCQTPTDRRMLVSMWDPSEKHQCLPTCHFAWQVYVRDKTFLDLMWHQRSVDVALGLPYDIAHYALLNHLLAATVGLTPGQIFGTFGDIHIYEEHVSGLRKQLKRVPYPLPQLILPDDATVFNFDPSEIKLLNYEYHPSIKMGMKV